MTILVILGLLFLAASAALIVRAVGLGRLRMIARVRQIETYGFRDTAEGALAGSGPPRGLTLNLLAERTGRLAATSVPSLKPLSRGQLMAAGYYGIAPDTFHGYRVVLGLSLPALEILNALVNGGSAALTIVLVALLGGLGYFGPMLFVVQRGRRRLEQIDRALPELIDVLTATVEAGLSFGGSLQLVADRFGGPLGAELRLTLQEQTMGLSTERALENMLERCDTPSVRAFIRAMSQAESLGVSVGAMMRSLATDARNRRRQLAREKVQRAPVKMLFPLVFLIFPAMLIVLLYPAVHQVLSQLANG